MEKLISAECRCMFVIVWLSAGGSFTTHGYFYLPSRLKKGVRGRWQFLVLGFCRVFYGMRISTEAHAFVVVIS
jgi:hypothetical protein